MFIQYVTQHWRGDRTHGTAFWVNVISVLICLKFAIAMLSIINVINNPVLSTRIWLVAILFVIFVLLPWSFIGSMRSSWKHIHLFHDRVTGTWLLIALAVTLCYCLAELKEYLPGLRNMVTIAIKHEDDTHNYSIISQDDRLYAAGFLTYGSAKKIINILKHNGSIKTIELNLTGAHLYEARKLSNYLASHQHNTHVYDTCALNCLIVFIGGEQRTSTEYADFSFHYRRGYDNGYRSDWTIEREQEKDRMYFEQRGVYKKSTYALYYKQTNDADIKFAIDTLKSYNVITQ